METVVKILSEFEVVSVLILFVLFCLAIKGIIDFIKWVKTTLEDYRKRKNAPEDKEEDMISRISSIATRVDRLERHDKDNYEKLQHIDTKIDEMMEETKRQSVITNRSALSRIAAEVKSQGYITSQQYEVFDEMATAYINAGGNGLFRNKIIPEIEAMEVRD